STSSIRGARWPRGHPRTSARTSTSPPRTWAKARLRNDRRSPSARMPVSAPALELDRVEVRHGAVHAVRGLSLTVDRGEIVGLIGPNGAGKSSTLHAIMGAVPVAGGDGRLDGHSLLGRRPEDVARAGVALVPEGRRIFADLTVEENLRLGAAGRRQGDLARVYELFPVVQEFRKRHAGALSGGQQQQLAIARALVARPE